MGVALGPPNGGAGGGIDKLFWLGKGEVTGATGVLLRAVGGLVTIGVSFQLDISFAFDGGGTEGVVFLGGAPNDGGGAP